MQFSDYSSDDVSRLVLAARAAALQLDGELFSIKQSLRDGDGKGGRLPFNTRSLSLDDRTWFEGMERKFLNLNAALAPFRAQIDNPAGPA